MALYGKGPLSCQTSFMHEISRKMPSAAEKASWTESYTNEHNFTLIRSMPKYSCTADGTVEIFTNVFKYFEHTPVKALHRYVQTCIHHEYAIHARNMLELTYKCAHYECNKTVYLGIQGCTKLSIPRINASGVVPGSVFSKPDFKTITSLFDVP